MTAQSADAVRDIAPSDARPGSSGRLRRLPLAAKLAFAFIGLVALVLLVNGAVEAWLRYNQAKHAALEVQADKARSAAEWVGEFLTEIQTELGWATGAEWKRLSLDQQRYDFIRLLRQAPAITALSYVDGQGKEQLAVSRLEPNSIASGKDFSGDPRFVRAVADKVWFGPVEFRRGSEPYMTIAVAHVGKNPGVTVADVNLKLIWDVISAIRVGEKGYAYVVDDKGRLIADPDLSLVLRDTDLSALPQVKKPLAELRSAETATSGPAAPLVRSAEIAKGLDGGDVLTAYAIAPKPRWIVFVQQPLAEALASVTQSLLRTLALLGLGLLLAVVTGIVLARRMAAPIRLLQAGAERLGAGDYSQRLDVRTGDEIEILAQRFNQMAERIKESYDTLEAKVEARTRDLNEALEQQTATADVLKVISRSAFDLETVLHTLVESAAKLCRADKAAITREIDGVYYRAESYGFSEEFMEEVRRIPLIPERGSISGRALLEGKAIQVEDVEADPEYGYKDLSKKGEFRTCLGIPMLRKGAPIGVLILYRTAVRAFSDKQIGLVQTFADQAVIAIENVRLLNALRHKTDELGRSVEELRALGEVSQAVNSTLDLQTVLSTIVAKAVQLSGTETGAIYVFEEVQRELQLRATYGMDHNLIDTLARQRIGLDETTVAQALAQREPVQIADLKQQPSSTLYEILLRAGFRAVLVAPLLRGEELVGLLVVRRRTPGAFPQNTIDLIKTFAAQSAVAIENARLFNNVETSLEELRTTQDRLVQTQKLASLGQLTAGIAHEIKNPLNFVNNFSDVSAELVDELQETLGKVKADANTLAEISELTNTLRDNLDKIVQHGKRADAIVKNMLLHSREGSGEHRLVKANALVEESLNLAYHGARAEKQGFKINIERSLDPAAGEVDVFPQEITRALLNLISNGFYAATNRKGQEDSNGYEPTLTASTKNLGDRVEFRIRDNGSGIPPEVREKMFNPFFTTKPAGEGTGLGLSITHDIIVKQHSGSIEVDTQLGEYTEVRIVLPRTAAFISESLGTSR